MLVYMDKGSFSNSRCLELAVKILAWDLSRLQVVAINTDTRRTIGWVA